MQLTDIGNPQYIALETYRKSGEGVITPVWAVAEDGKLFVWTMGDSWKVKRIRKNPRVRLAAGDARGNPQSGWAEAQARVLDTPEEEAKMRSRLAKKYGLMYRLFGLMAKLRGGDSGHVVLEISPA